MTIYNILKYNIMKYKMIIYNMLKYKMTIWNMLIYNTMKLYFNLNNNNKKKIK